MSDSPRRVRLELLRKRDRAEAPSARSPSRPDPARVPPSLGTKLTRRAARVRRWVGVELGRAFRASTDVHVDSLETDAGRARRARVERFVAALGRQPVAEGWVLRGVQRLERGAVWLGMAHLDGTALTLVLERRGAKKRAFQTDHLSVSYRTERTVLGPERARPLLEWAERATRAAEQEAIQSIEGFPASLFGRETPRLDFYPAEARIELRPTLACDHHCDFCSSVARDGTDNALSGVGELRATRAHWERLPIGRVVITGGEPTLLGDLPGLVAELSDAGLAVELQTNGMALDDPRYAQSLAHAGVRDVLVSLHSRDPLRSDEHITRYPGAWMRTVRGIDGALAAGMRVSISHVVSRANRDETLEFFQFVDARWGRRIRIRLSFVAPTGDAAEALEQVMPRMEEVAPAMRRALAFAGAHRLPVVVVAYCGVPPCLLQPYERYSEVARGRRTAYGEDRIKLAACRGCDFDASCPGLWRRYYERHGDPGLAPIRRPGWPFAGRLRGR